MKPYYDHDGVTLYHGSAERLPLADGTVQTCVTSPPYWGLRAYGTGGQVWGGPEDCKHEWEESRAKLDVGNNRNKRGKDEIGNDFVTPKWDGTKNQHSVTAGAFCRQCGAWFGELGLEPTPELYVSHLVTVFHEVRRVLKADGTAWLNLGDSYAGGAGGRGDIGNIICGTQTRTAAVGIGRIKRELSDGLKTKDLVGIPWMVAFALRADGWYLRSDIIWHKPNPMPENVTDRPTKAHEYIFLLAKSADYFCDMEAIAEPSIHAGKHVRTNGNEGMDGGYDGHRTRDGLRRGVTVKENRNRRSVWTVCASPYPGAHFATFPPELITPCILAGSRPGDVVLDNFNGSGTTGEVARKHGRRYVGIELNPEYLAMTRERFRQGYIFPVGVLEATA